MKIYCPHCNQIYDIDTNLWGRYVECEVCNKKFVAGQSAFKNRPASQICLPTPPQKRNRISPKTIIAISGGISILLVIGFTWFMTKFKSDGTDEAKVCQKIVSISELGDSKIDNCETDEKPAVNVPAPKLHEEKPCPKIESVSEFGDSKFYNYKSDKILTVVLSELAAYDGVLGFRWGDRPKESGYRFPCNIEHPSEGSMFSKVELGYNPRGELFSIKCSLTYDIPIPDFSQVPRRMQKKLRINFIERTCLPIFNTIKEVAEIILDKNFKCFYGEKQFSGMTTDEGNIMGIITLDIKDNGPYASMLIMNLKK